MAEKYLPLVRKIAWRIFKRLPLIPTLNPDDLINSGAIGLIGAINKFDALRHVKFGTYASIRIECAILESLRNWDFLSRNSRKKVKDAKKAEAKLAKILQRESNVKECFSHVSFDDWFFNNPDSEFLFTENGSDNPFTILAKKEERTEIKRLLSVLSARQRQIVYLYYFEELSQKQIGKIFNLTGARICQILFEAIAIMRRSSPRPQI